MRCEIDPGNKLHCLTHDCSYDAQCYKAGCPHCGNPLADDFAVYKVAVDLFKEVMTLPQEGKEVHMKHCTLCQREIPAAGPESGIGYKEEVLCGTCLKAARRVCPHTLKKEDGVTCRDCGARPWTLGRVLRGSLRGVRTLALGTVKVFVIYTIQAILGSVVTLALAYFFARKMGFIP